MVEGADRVLGWRSPNHVYQAAATPGLRLLPRNYRLSDDVGFRFGQRTWEGWPLTAEKYARWIAASGGTSAHLYVDYETFGEHQWVETGIFDFLRHLPDACAREGLGFVHPSVLAEREPVAALSFPEPTSWADLERDTSAWLGNRIQQAAHTRLYDLRREVLASGAADQLDAWRRLTTSDHVYYMCTKHFGDGDVHQYFSPYETPYDAFVSFMNVVQDLAQSVAGPPARAPLADERASLPEMACVA
jgi:alpha-amylase